MTVRGKLSHALGRRGAVLLMLGIVWIVQGIGIAVSPSTREAGAYALVHEQLPTWLRVTLWCATGAVALICAFRRHPGGDAAGFIALVIQPLVRLGSFTWGFLLYTIPGAPAGYPRGLLGMATWGTITALIMVISGWADPRHRAITHPEA